MNTRTFQIQEQAFLHETSIFRFRDKLSSSRNNEKILELLNIERKIMHTTTTTIIIYWNILKIIGLLSY